MKPLIKAGARGSKLSRAQVEEISNEFDLTFDVIYVNTKGDLDKKTSLRALDKCDFFTKEIDEMVLDGRCRIGIHSAKDLPDPLPEGLRVIVFTKGVDPSDVLVLREGESLTSGMTVATSSERREESVRQLARMSHRISDNSHTLSPCLVSNQGGPVLHEHCSHPNVSQSEATEERFIQRSGEKCGLGVEVNFVDIRGTIEERLKRLTDQEVDGVVIAEAALIRLGLTHLNRIYLPGETAPLQGRLAVVGREEDEELTSLFRC